VKNYTVAEPFWRQGILLEAGEPLKLTDAEAKHIKHLLNEVSEKSEPDAQPSAESAAEAEHVEDPQEAPAARDGADPEAVAVNAKVIASLKARR
jgi:hypothetical protein